MSEIEFDIADLRRGLQSALDAFAENLAQFANALGPALERWGEWAASPEGQMTLTVAKAESQMPSCHCLCGFKHRDQMGICEGVAITETVVQTFRSGDTWIPVCRACAVVWQS